jgi:hypothetical protein
VHPPCTLRTRRRRLWYHVVRPITQTSALVAVDLEHRRRDQDEYRWSVTERSTSFGKADLRNDPVTRRGLLGPWCVAAGRSAICSPSVSLMCVNVCRGEQSPRSPAGLLTVTTCRRRLSSRGEKYSCIRGLYRDVYRRRVWDASWVPPTPGAARGRSQPTGITTLAVGSSPAQLITTVGASCASTAHAARPDLAGNQ